jgi:hypothetical protein
MVRGYESALIDAVRMSRKRRRTLPGRRINRKR